MRAEIRYWKDVLRTARRRTSFFARDKMLAGFLVSTVAFTAQWRLGLHSLGGVLRIFITFTAPYVVVISGTFLFNVLAVPADRDRESTAEVRTLRARNQALAIEKEVLSRERIDPNETRRRQLVAERLPQLSPDELGILERLSDCGEIPLSRLSQVLGMHPNKVVDATKRLQKMFLLKDARTETFSADRWYSIVEELKDAVSYCLEQRRGS